MASSTRSPGPLGVLSLSIDDGMLCRSKSSATRTLGIASLEIDEVFLKESKRSIFRESVKEALRRGANSFDLLDLRFRYSRWLTADQDSQCSNGNMVWRNEVNAADEAWAHSVISQEERSFQLQIDTEWRQMGDFAGAKEGIKSLEEYRYKIRPFYYGYGYLDPIEFLGKIIQHNFLGRFKIWIHRDLGQVLDKTMGILEGWSAGLSNSVASEVKAVSGIQIRPIANSKVISNHAFGLAIDIDPLSNPHIVTAESKAVLNWVAAQAGASFDFGKIALSSAERVETKMSVDDVMEVHNRALSASKAIQDWLGRNLPRHRELMAKLREAEKSVGIAIERPVTELSSRVRSILDSPKTESYEKAVKDAEEVYMALSEDENLKRVQILYTQHEPAYINTWEKKGLLTVPLYLACVLVGEQGLRWGEQYGNSKDAMHFELMGSDGKDKIKPQMRLTKSEGVRTLKSYMNDPFREKAYSPVNATGKAGRSADRT